MTSALNPSSDVEMGDAQIKAELSDATKAPSIALPRRWQPAFPKHGEWLFFLELENLNLLKKVVDILLLQMSEINFELRDDGVHIVGMESSQIALVDIYIAKKNFITFSISRPCTVGISLQLLRDMLKQASADDFLRFYQPNSSSSSVSNVHLEFYSKKLIASRVSYKWRPLDIECDAITAPNHLVQGEPSVSIPTYRFRELMGDFKNLSDAVEVTLNKEHLTWHITEEKRIIYMWIDQRTDVEDMNESTVTDSSMHQNSRLKLNTQNTNLGQSTTAFRPWKKTFGLKHLNIFAQASTLSERLDIWFSGMHPACFHFDLEGEKENGYARFWLAAYAETAKQEQ